MQRIKRNVYLKQKITLADRRLVFVLAKLSQEQKKFSHRIFYLKLIIATLTNVIKPKIWHLLYINAILKAADLAGNEKSDIDFDGDPVELLDETLAKVAVKLTGMTQERLANECSPEELRQLWNEAVKQEEIKKIDFEKSMINANLVATASNEDRIDYISRLDSHRLEIQSRSSTKQLGQPENEIDDNVIVFKFKQ